MQIVPWVFAFYVVRKQILSFMIPSSNDTTYYLPAHKHRYPGLLEQVAMEHARFGAVHRCTDQKVQVQQHLHVNFVTGSWVHYLTNSGQVVGHKN